MSTYDKTTPTPLDMVKAEQNKMKAILIPSKRQLLDNRTELQTEKYSPNFHMTNYLQNTSELLNAVNRLRGWQQNGSTLNQYAKESLKYFRSIPSLIQYQFLNIPYSSPENPYDYITRTACISFLRGLTWVQLKNEMKQPKLDNLDNLISQVIKHSKQIKTRPKCPKCELYITNQSRHLKTHKITFNRKENQRSYRKKTII